MAFSETACITPDLEGQVWLKSIRYPLLNRVINLCNPSDIRRDSRGELISISGRSVPVGIIEYHDSRRFTLPIMANTIAEADALDIILATGEVMFIHTPAENQLGCGRVSNWPGGYVMYGTTEQVRTTPGSRRYLFEVPCQNVAPPGPDVVGTTLTVQGTINLYGSIEALWAAVPTIRDLWDTIGSLEDTVVI